MAISHQQSAISRACGIYFHCEAIFPAIREGLTVNYKFHYSGGVVVERIVVSFHFLVIRGLR